MFSNTIEVVSDEHISSLDTLGIRVKIGDVLPWVDIVVAYQNSLKKHENQDVEIRLEESSEPKFADRMSEIEYNSRKLLRSAERHKLSTSYLVLKNHYDNSKTAPPTNPNDTMFSLGVCTFISGAIVETLSSKKTHSSLGTGLLVGGSAFMAYSWFFRQNNIKDEDNIPKGKQEYIAR